MLTVLWDADRRASSGIRASCEQHIVHASSTQAGSAPGVRCDTASSDGMYSPGALLNKMAASGNYCHLVLL